MTHLKSLARTTLATLRFLALVSGPIAAVFGYLAWHETRTTGEQAIVQSAQENEHRERDLEIQKGVLEAVLKIVPETARTREGIERLLALTTERLTAVREARRKARQSARPAARSRARSTTRLAKPLTPKAPAVLGWWQQYGPDSKASRTSDKIFSEIEARH